jgi:hypothetical protein
MVSPVQRPPSVGGPSSDFLEAKVRLRVARIACRDAWLDARSGEPVARRRYRAALRRQERAARALRQLEMAPGTARSSLGRTTRPMAV